VEIYCALLPKLDADVDSADRLIAEFLSNQQHTSVRACSGCAGDYEDPDATAPGDIHNEAEETVSPATVEKLFEQQS
jgi:hypothetical protein